MTKEVIAYVYFRFYANTTEIEAGLNKYSRQWFELSNIGYNYKEYRCWTFNSAGLTEWAGGMEGYTTSERESGFSDASPSSSIIDHTVIMGSYRYMGKNVEALNGFKPGTHFVFRQVAAQDTGVEHKVQFDFDENQRIIHPVMYTLDETKTELIKQTGLVTDNSNVDSYDISVDCDTVPAVGTISTNYYTNVSNFSHMFNNSADEFCSLTNADLADYYINIDFGSVYTNLFIELYNWCSAGFTSNTRISSSVDGLTWNSWEETGNNDGKFEYSNIPRNFRYIRIFVDKGIYTNNGKVDIYRLIVT